jgi:hypothetical protein
VGFTGAEREALGLTGRLPAAVLRLRERFEGKHSGPPADVLGNGVFVQDGVTFSLR